MRFYDEIKNNIHIVFGLFISLRLKTTLYL